MTLNASLRMENDRLLEAAGGRIWTCKAAVLRVGQELGLRNVLLVEAFCRVENMVRINGNGFRERE
jgi:hypothetical protein